MIGKRLLNAKECAEYIGSTEGTVYMMVSKKTIPYVKMGRSVRFDVHDLDKLIETNKRGYQTDQVWA